MLTLDFSFGLHIWFSGVFGISVPFLHVFHQLGGAHFFDQVSLGQGVGFEAIILLKNFTMNSAVK